MRLLRMMAVLAFFALKIPLANAEVKVGVILPLSGDFAYFGEQVRQGMSIAMEELRATGVEVPQLIFEDDKCLAKEAVTAFRKLVSEDKVEFLIGPACSTSIQSVAPLASRERKVPVLFLLDSGSPVANLPDPLYSFGFDPSALARMLAKELFQRKISQVVTATEEEEYSVLITKAFESEWATLGGKVLLSDSQAVNSADLRSSISRILAKKPQAVFYSSAYNSGIFLKQIRTVSPTIPIYGNDTMCTAETIDVAGEAAEGARCANVVLDETRVEVKAFRQSIEKKFGKAPSALFFEALGYDSIILLLKELKVTLTVRPTLLGVNERNQNGMYDVRPSLIEIQAGKMKVIGND